MQTTLSKRVLTRLAMILRAFLSHEICFFQISSLGSHLRRRNCSDSDGLKLRSAVVCYPGLQLADGYVVAQVVLLSVSTTVC